MNLLTAIGIVIAIPFLLVIARIFFNPPVSHTIDDDGDDESVMLKRSTEACYIGIFSNDDD